MKNNWIIFEIENDKVITHLYETVNIKEEYNTPLKGLSNEEIIKNFANDIQALIPFENILGAFLSVKEEKSLVKKGVCDFGYGLTDPTNDLSDYLNVPVAAKSRTFLSRDITEIFPEVAESYSWELNYYGYIGGKQNRSQESLLTVGNGYLGVRGSLSESKASDDHYPASYVAGIYNRQTTRVADRDVVNEDFVALPNWTLTNFSIDGDRVDVNSETIVELNRTLLLKTSELTIEAIIKDAQGRETKVVTQRIVSFDRRHVALQKYSVTPLNYDGVITIESAIDGDIINYGVDRYRSLNSDHLTNKIANHHEQYTQLYVETNESQIGIFTAMKHSVSHENAETATFVNNGLSGYCAKQKVAMNEAFVVTKFAGIVTSKEVSSDLGTFIYDELNRVDTYEQIVAENVESWKVIWNKIDIKISNDVLSQKILRLHAYHLIVSASSNNETLDASVTARGLHGEAYRGHIFWDEIFVLPFYDLHFPKAARQILMYRYDRLEKARENAKAHGYEGAMFPWQSGSDGSEETQTYALNPVTGEWHEDSSSYQRHVSLAIAYNAWYYTNVTNDIEFMQSYGAEMIFEVARFWSSRSVKDETTGRFTIDKVMGPDEFHEGYPGQHGGGVRDNAYTNMMVAWLFGKVTEIKEILGDHFTTVANKLNLSDAEISHWENIRKGLNLVINEQGIISQYDGYFDLKELDWNFYREKYGNIYRMDRLLKAEGESADDYKVAKQADTLMTFYNLDKDVIDAILADLNYEMPEDYLERNLMYYLDRTSHGSTLSRIVHAKLAKMINNDELSWQLYTEALGSDYRDVQGGTTAEGIHTGVMAATIDVAITTFAGVDTRGTELAIKPRLPKQWDDMKFNLDFKGVNYAFEISKNEIRILTSNTVILNANNATINVEKDVVSVIKY